MKCEDKIESSKEFCENRNGENEIKTSFKS